MDIITLFSGMGHYEQALKNIGVDFNIKVYTEEDEYKSFAYELLHGEQINAGNILEYKAKSFPPHDLLLMTFPYKNIEMMKRDYKGSKGDTASKSEYFWHAMDIIERNMPENIVIETVSSLAEYYTDNLQIWLDFLSDLGYNNYWKVLDARDFGVPQLRERLFIVSTLNDKDYCFPDNNEDYNIYDYLEDEDTIPETFYMQNAEHGIRIVNDRFLANRNRNYFIVYTKRKYINCLDKYYYKGIDKHARRTAVVAGHGVRQLTPLETWRLMGWTDEQYKFIRKRLIKDKYNGKDRVKTKLYMMVTTGIVIDVLESLLTSLLERGDNVEG